jgi:hypothetical protein
MAKRRQTTPQLKALPETLTGWKQIATFLGQPPSVVQRWASDGMPVRREGRFVTTTQSQLNEWLGRETGKPVHVATDETDLSAELKRGLNFLRGKNARIGKRAARRASGSKKAA